MIEIDYQAFVWLIYRLTATFALGVPLVLYIWSFLKKEESIIRLLSIYWKNASLIAISMLLFTGENEIAFISSFLSPIFMVGSVWFWIDLNEDLADYPPQKALPLTTKIWRWCLTFWGLLYISISFQTINCINLSNIQIIKELNLWKVT